MNISFICEVKCKLCPEQKPFTGCMDERMDGWISCFVICFPRFLFPCLTEQSVGDEMQ